MVGVAPLQVIGIVFDSERPATTTVLDRLRGVHPNATMRFLDVLCVKRDVRGVLSAQPQSADIEVCCDPAGSVLWQLLVGHGSDESLDASLDLRSAREVGLDLLAVERLAYEIQPCTSALLLLVETTWLPLVLDTAAGADGVPLVCGYLEPETMLVIGLALATATEAGDRAVRARAADRSALLETGANRPSSPRHPSVAVLRALVRAGLIDIQDVGDAVRALDDAQLL